MNKEGYRIARVTKDKSFNGEFFFGVRTTNIFCRPSCPSPVAKEENVLYFDTMFKALEMGFRPCMRCRPDINVGYLNGNVDGAETVNTALEMIYDGYLSYHNISDLAKELFISERHLRKLFNDNVGIPPVKIARYHKAIFSKRLLLFSALSMTDIASVSGFGSIRQFNDVFKEIFGVSPSGMRKETYKGTEKHKEAVLLLPYEGHFDFNQMLLFMKDRAIKGVEVINDGSYSRTFRTNDAKGYFVVSNNPEKSALELRIVSDDIRCYMIIYNKVQKMFDLDRDLSVINEKLKRDPILSQGMDNGEVPRLPLAFDTFEFVVKAATTLAGRITEKAAIKCDDDYPIGLAYFFPTPEELKSLNLEQLGITKPQQSTLRKVVDGVIDNSISFTKNQSFEAFKNDFSAIKGIGDWTVDYVAMRGLGMVDSFPATDLGVINALRIDNKKLTRKEILKAAEKWRPYRAYATLCLWNIERRRRDKNVLYKI
ncbi:MAG: DNA repair protein and transcriptional regulator, AraC family [Clostridiales bacterium 38_11]|nr:MAG: DNA repair protein and transcriptional regulator, AraC family [Clostridiales bacterium 38_11]